MDLRSIGHLIARQRRAKGFTLRVLADKAGVGRSTLAALESGKLAELGLQKVARLCEALDLTLEARSFELDAPLLEHRHLTEQAGRDLTKSAIDDVITRGDITAWRGLVKAMKSDTTGRIMRRVREVASTLRTEDTKAAAFYALIPIFKRVTRSKPRSYG